MTVEVIASFFAKFCKGKMYNKMQQIYIDLNMPINSYVNNNERTIVVIKTCIIL